MNLLNSLIIGTKIRVQNFLNEEKGVSSIVATVLLILIVVLLASIFWETISDWFTTTWARIMGSDTISR